MERDRERGRIAADHIRVGVIVMRRAALGLLLAASLALPAHAQTGMQWGGSGNQSNLALIAPTAPTSDSSDRIANTAWVNQFLALGIPLASGKIFIGSAGGIATAQTMSGDCTLIASGVITCTQSAGAFTVNGALSVTGGVLQTNIVAPATPAAGKTQVYVDSTTKTLSAKNDAGTVSNAVVASVAVANQFMTGISAAGVITRAQPAVADVSGFGTGVAAFLGTPSSANLAAAVTGETGSGALVFGTSPNITTPTGIVKGDVGLGNVANVDTTNAANISSGTLPAGRMPALTGDITTSVGAVATTLATVASAGTTGSATATPVVTIDAKGRTTSVTTVPTSPYRAVGLTTASAVATIDIAVPAGARFLEIRLYDFTPATANQDLQMLVSTNSGSSYDTTTTNYRYTGTMAVVSGTTGVVASGGGLIPILARTQTGAQAFSSIIHWALASGSTSQSFNFQTTYLDNTAVNYVNFTGGGLYVPATAITNIRLRYAAGNITTGTYLMTAFQ